MYDTAVQLEPQGNEAARDREFERVGPIVIRVLDELVERWEAARRRRAELERAIHAQFDVSLSLALDRGVMAEEALIHDIALAPDQEGR